MGQPVVWFEVMGSDIARSSSFYEKMFGWHLKPLDGETPYSLVEGLEGVPGGVGQSPTDARWTTFYVGVPDTKAAVEQAQAIGAKVLMPVTDLPDGTRVAVVSDPDGLPIGLAQAA